MDEQLHCGGWPQAAVSELLLKHNGMGEIRLLSPLLSRLSRRSGYLTWINPPFLLNAPALADQGLQLDKIIIIQTNSVQETIWSAQQAMTSQACSTVLVWLPKKRLSTEIRKLNLAAKAGNCWGIIFREYSLQLEPSAATLRMVLEFCNGKHQLTIIKQPDGWPGQKILLELFPERINWNALTVKDWPTVSPKSSKTPPVNSLADSPSLALNIAQQQKLDKLQLTPHSC